MFSHDQEYLSGMSTVALVVLMVIAMCCIRAFMPDETADGAGEIPQVVEIPGHESSVHTAMSEGEGKAPRHR